MKQATDAIHRTAAQRPAPLHTIFITLDFMKRMGIPVDVLLRGTGISPSDIERPNAMVTHAQEMVLFANALEATGNTAIGLHIGNAIPVTSYGLRGHAMLVSPTLGDALRLGFEHPLLGISYFRMRITAIDDTARIAVGGYTYRTDLLVVNTDMVFTAYRHGFYRHSPADTRFDRAPSGFYENRVRLSGAAARRILCGIFQLPHRIRVQ